MANTTSTKIDFNDSNISSEFRYNLMDHYAYKWNASITADWYRVVFFTIADVLKYKRVKSAPKTGFILKDDKGEFVFGAIMIYHSPDDEDSSDDDKGNYTLEFTFDQNDMKDMDAIEDNHSDIFVTCLQKSLDSIIRARLLQSDFGNNIFMESIRTLKNYLDANAPETGEFSVELRGVFTGTVSVEGDKKLISIEPGEMVKQSIKSDSSL